jgi:putative tricarboxylic transport membrane protein
MKHRVPTDGLVWVILGIGMCIGSVKLKLGDFHIPGPGFLPFLSGVSLGIFGLILTFSAALAKPGEGEEATYEKSQAKWNWKKFLNPLITLLILLAYLVLLEPLGFILTTFICLLFWFKLSEPKKWLMPLILSVSTSVLSYLLFSVWLQCQFPKGLLRFW